MTDTLGLYVLVAWLGNLIHNCLLCLVHIAHFTLWLLTVCDRNSKYAPIPSYKVLVLVVKWTVIRDLHTFRSRHCQRFLQSH